MRCPIEQRFGIVHLGRAWGPFILAVVLLRASSPTVPITRERRYEGTRSSVEGRICWLLEVLIPRKVSSLRDLASIGGFNNQEFLGEPDKRKLSFLESCG